MFCPFRPFLASFLLCRWEIRALSPFRCVAVQRILWGQHLVARRGPETVAGGGTSTLGGWTGHERRKAEEGRRIAAGPGHAPTRAVALHTL
jgi:hypothetical protein